MIDEAVLKQNIIEALHLEALDDDKKIALVEKMAEVVQKKITLRVLEELPEEKKNELEKLIDGSPKKVGDFLQGAMPNFSKVIQEEVVKFKKELVEKMEKEKN